MSPLSSVFAFFPWRLTGGSEREITLVRDKNTEACRVPSLALNNGEKLAITPDGTDSSVGLRLWPRLWGACHFSEKMSPTMNKCCQSAGTHCARPSMCVRVCVAFSSPEEWRVSNEEAWGKGHVLTGIHFKSCCCFRVLHLIIKLKFFYIFITTHWDNINNSLSNLISQICININNTLYINIIIIIIIYSYYLYIYITWKILSIKMESNCYVLSQRERDSLWPFQITHKS